MFLTATVVKHCASPVDVTLPRQCAGAILPQSRSKYDRCPVYAWELQDQQHELPCVGDALPQPCAGATLPQTRSNYMTGAALLRYRNCWGCAIAIVFK